MKPLYITFMPRLLYAALELLEINKLPSVYECGFFK